MIKLQNSESDLQYYKKKQFATAFTR